jgi:uncharacterized alkaline shock family protein YloU
MMIFNRVFTILALGVMCAGAVLMLLMVGGIVALQPALLPDWLAVLVNEIQRAQGRYMWQLGIGAASAASVALLLLALEMRALLTRLPPALMLRHTPEGSVTVAVDSIRELASREAREIEGVRDSRTAVAASSRGIRLTCRILVDQSVSVPQLADEVQSRLRSAIERVLGEPVQDVSVAAQTTPFADGRSQRRIR